MLKVICSDQLKSVMRCLLSTICCIQGFSGILSTICCIQGFSGILSKTFSEHCSFYNEILTRAVIDIDDIDASIKIGCDIDIDTENGYVREIWIGVREMSGNFVLPSLYEPWVCHKTS